MTGNEVDDPLWPHLYPLWTALQEVASSDLLVADANEETRKFAQRQAIKHAEDVCRIIASMTRKEQETAGAVCAALKDSPTFQRAVSIWNATFGNENSPAVLSAKLNWSREDFVIIGSVGRRWFA